MRVVLEVIGGTRAGLRTTLHAGQSISIGRSDWADFACPWDEAMSREHFRLEIDPVTCKLTDLNSRNGTRVNDQPIAGALLRDRDEIKAGDTTFRIRIEGDSPELAKAVHQTAYVEVPPDSGILKGLTGGLKGTFQTETLSNGVHCSRIELDNADPHVLGDLLGRNRPLHLILDLARAGVEPPEDLPRRYLFEFLAPEAKEQVSPLLVSTREYKGWHALAEAAWGQDAVIYLFTRTPHDQLLEDLRQACMPNRGGGVEGICWPGVLGAMLTSADSEHLPGIVENISALLIESPDAPEQIRLFSLKDVHQRLERFGLREVIPEPAEATDSKEHFPEDR